MIDSYWKKITKDSGIKWLTNCNDKKKRQETLGRFSEIIPIFQDQCLPYRTLNHNKFCNINVFVR